MRLRSRAFTGSTDASFSHASGTTARSTSSSSPLDVLARQLRSHQRERPPVPSAVPLTAFASGPAQ
eukprot:1156806-Prymnesium_polylepis.1